MYKQGNTMSFRWIGKDDSTDTVLLKKMGPINIEKNTTSEEVIKIAFIDVETTGLDYKKEEIIELGLIVLAVGKTSAKIYEVLYKKSHLQEPSKELSEKIQKITNIKMSDLVGKKIDVEEINQQLLDVSVVVAHNAGFDRPFVEKIIPIAKLKIWSCTYSQIPWDNYGFPEKSLKNLCFYHGFYFEAHRAVSDCEATIALATMTAPDSTENYLSKLLEKASQKSLFLIARKTDYKFKDFFRENSFNWSDSFNYKIYEENDLELAQQMLDKLVDTVYSDRLVGAEIIEIDIHEKFKSPSEFTTKKGFDLNILGKYTKDYVLLVENSYEHRQLLARRGYTLSKKYSGWYVFLSEKELESEKAWLVESGVFNVAFGGKILKNSYKRKG